MRHAVRKIKIKNGQDANEMLMKKMISNFFLEGKLTSTDKRIKTMKPIVDQIAYFMSNEKNKADDLLKKYINSSDIRKSIQNVFPQDAKNNGSITKIIKLHTRASDGALMSQLQWTIEKKVQLEKETKDVQEKEPKEKDQKKPTGTTKKPKQST